MNDPLVAKQKICEIGQRLYQKGFAAANEGNLSIRIEDQVFCTPTLTCKGYMSPEDICTVDLAGNQIAGQRKKTSEILLHLEVYNRRPDVKAVVHCHPPHATAFAISNRQVPIGILPEPDIFLGRVPTANYALPGTSKFASSVAPFLADANTIILQNHGTVSFSDDLETAFWMTEILDAYCRTLILAEQLGCVEPLPTEEVVELVELRRQWGFEDPRTPAEIEQQRNQLAPSNRERPTSFTESDLDRLAERIAETLKTR